MRERIRERELGAVRRAPERDPLDTERNPDRLDVLRVILRRIEGDGGADRLRARRHVLDEVSARLEARALQSTGLPRPTRVVGDEGVAREERPEARAVSSQVEESSAGLAGTAGKDEHDAARAAVSRQLLHV